MQDKTRIDSIRPRPASPLEQKRQRILLYALQCEIPAMGAHVRSLLSLAATPSVSAPALSDIVLRDYGLTTRFLRTINSAFFSPTRKPVLSMRRIMVLIGLENIVKTASSIPTFTIVNGHLDDHDPTIEIMALSVLASSMASGLSEFMDVDPEELMTCAMLQSLGDILMAFVMGGVYNIISSRRRISDARRIYKKRTGWLPRELGICVARKWNLPEMVRQCIMPPKRGLVRIGKKKASIIAAASGIYSLVESLKKRGHTTRYQKNCRNLLARDLKMDERLISRGLELGITNFREKNPLLYDFLYRRDLLTRLEI